MSESAVYFRGSVRNSAGPRKTVGPNNKHSTSHGYSSQRHTHTLTHLHTHTYTPTHTHTQTCMAGQMLTHRHTQTHKCYHMGHVSGTFQDYSHGSSIGHI